MEDRHFTIVQNFDNSALYFDFRKLRLKNKSADNIISIYLLLRDQISQEFEIFKTLLTDQCLKGKNMRKYERKLKWTIILFLGICALVINLATYFIITNSMNEKFMELAQNHIEHQYENCQHKMAVLEQQFISLGSNAQFISAVGREDQELVEKKLKNFYQSTQGISAMAVYALKDGSMEYLTGQGKLRYDDKKFVLMTESAILDEAEPNWYILQQEAEKSIGFLCPIVDEKQVGCMFVKFSIDNFMPEIKNGEDYDFWEEHLAVADEELVWTDDPACWDEMDTSGWEERYDYRLKKQTLMSSKAITRTGASLIQVITLKMEKKYGMIALGLTALFFLCMIVIYVSVNKLIGNIIEVLINLKKKMEQIH